MNRGNSQLSIATLDAFGNHCPAKLVSSRQKSLTRWSPWGPLAIKLLTSGIPTKILCSCNVTATPMQNIFLLVELTTPRQEDYFRGIYQFVHVGRDPQRLDAWISQCFSTSKSGFVRSGDMLTREHTEYVRVREKEEQRGILQVKDTQQEKQRENSFKEAWSLQWHRPRFQSFYFFNTYVEQTSSRYTQHCIVIYFHELALLLFFMRFFFKSLHQNQ